MPYCSKLKQQKKTRGKKNNMKMRKKTLKGGKSIKNKKNYKKGGKKQNKYKKTLKKRFRLKGGSCGFAPYELCNLGENLKYTNTYNSNILAGEPRTLDPSPAYQPLLGKH